MWNNFVEHVGPKLLYSQICIFKSSNKLQTFAFSLYHKLNSAFGLADQHKRLYNTVIPQLVSLSTEYFMLPTQYISLSVQICAYVRC